jgi:glycosyltransferase 2 family protein
MRVRIAQIIIGLGCTFFFLALALHRVQLGSVSAALTNAKPIWIGAAVVSYAIDLSLRARRWQIILRPVAAIPYPIVARALLVGYGLNTIMPARLGELFRAEFFKKTYGLSRVWALTSIVIERLFDGLVVVACLGVGLALAAMTRHTPHILVDVVLTGGAVFGMILVGVLCLAGPTAARLCRRFPKLSTQLVMVQRGFEILRTWRTVEIAILTLILYVPDSMSMWFIVKAVGPALGLADTLVLLGAASLISLVPSGPAFLGTLQFAYALAIEFAGGSRVVGIAAATLAQLFLLVPVALIATALLIHGSGSAVYAILARKESDDAAAGR